MAGKSGKKDHKRSSADALPIFKATQIARLFKTHSGVRVSKDAVKVAAVYLQVLIGEVATDAINKAKMEKKKKVLPHHILCAIKDDPDLSTAFPNIVIEGGGRGVIAPTMESLKRDHMNSRAGRTQ